MYTDKNIIYADAGKYLKRDHLIAFQIPESYNVQEFDLNTSDIHITGNLAYYNNNLCAQFINPNWKYSDYKKDIIKKRYSNDDQIAIILNKDDSEEDKIRYQKMMEWREFAATLAKKIIETLQNDTAN